MYNVSRQVGKESECISFCECAVSNVHNNRCVLDSVFSMSVLFDTEILTHMYMYVYVYIHACTVHVHVQCILPAMPPCTSLSMKSSLFSFLLA